MRTTRNNPTFGLEFSHYLLTIPLTKLPPSLHADTCGGYLCNGDRRHSRASSELATLLKQRPCSQAQASTTFAATLPTPSSTIPKGIRYTLSGETPHRFTHNAQTNSRTSQYKGEKKADEPPFVMVSLMAMGNGWEKKRAVLRKEEASRERAPDSGAGL
ncbi:hypothetical protein NQZ68_015968 [Dissostichus eleginoides]|nr:hypothetical protein NQZ68_015968 [Dissostichus eleginoides]